MKAAEYVEQIRAMLKAPPLLSTIYDDTPTEKDGPAAVEDIGVKVCFGLLREARALAEARGAKTDAAWIACVYEQNEKWRAIVRRLEDPRFQSDCFERFAKALAKALLKAGAMQ